MMNQLNGKSDRSKLLIQNKIEISTGLNKKGKLTNFDKNLNKSLNDLNLNGHNYQSNLNKSTNYDLDNLNKLNNLNTLNTLNKANQLDYNLNSQFNNNMTTMDKFKIHKYFNDNLNNNDNDLDNLNLSNRKQIKSTSFESNLTDDSIHSNDFINGDPQSNNLEEIDEFDKQPTEMDELLDKRSFKDQKIVEVVS